VRWRAVSLVGAALLGAACTSGAALSTMTSTPVTTTSSTTTTIVSGYGLVCGATWLVGGLSPSRPGPALLRSCPSGARETSGFKLMASDGTVYPAYIYGDRRWSAELPAGTYRAVDAPGCPGRQQPFTVAAGETTLGVVVKWGCLYF